MMIRDVNDLAAEANQYCAAFFYGSFRGLIEQGSAASIGGQGTMTFVTMGGRYFGATNKRVIADDPDTVGDRVFHVAFAKHTPLRYQPVAVTDFDNPDPPYDLAVYEIPRELVESNGKEFIDVAVAPCESAMVGDSALLPQNNVMTSLRDRAGAHRSPQIVVRTYLS